ncbi:glycosyltransferase [Escherichia albertii]|uniref:glycosyltransferase n=1 Tax=Escherichia albertii TaxID=208962 RepID=UPI002362D554|nr:glycosyltransferase [Escherichia albertii]MCZ8595006.1 glycosyltransferase [Escherichia albertii]WDB26164.1 glycosyltransferase [Escherichia albertii]WDB53458.1 glycosyltransferase [Escherichia albertii]
MYKVLVLLAVYNGREWIDQQLNSILVQKNVQIDILASVDLSADGSYEYIRKNYPDVHLLPYGEKYGSAGKNFYRLILDAQFNKYDYISFADQDDIWFADKLSHAIQVINEKRVDAYSGNVTAFWEDGRQVLIDKSQPQVELDYFFEAAGPGCTYVFTTKLAQSFQSFLKNNIESQDVALHDWLLYAYARSNHYQWYIDGQSKMLYRQHANNQVGANESLKAICKRYHLVKKGWYKKEVVKLIDLFGANNQLLIKNIGVKRILPRVTFMVNINKIRRRLRDRYAFLIFYILRFI